MFQAAEHIAALKSHAFYLLHVHLKQGYDLAAKDANGLSDPYVKFFLRGTNKAAHKSKTVYKDLNPVWDERFVIPVEDPFVPIDIKVGATGPWDLGCVLLDLGSRNLGSIFYHSSYFPLKRLSACPLFPLVKRDLPRIGLNDIPTIPLRCSNKRPPKLYGYAFLISTFANPTERQPTTVKGILLRPIGFNRLGDQSFQT